MKAVVYHADARFAWGDPVGDLYKRLFERFREQCKKYGMEVIHLTLDGCPLWGDTSIQYSGLDAKNVVLNREECFTRFLESADHDVYWFTEPDFEILQMWPPLESDCAMLYREGDAVPMNPAWRMATPKALPFFRKLRDELRAVKIVPGVGHDWHGDSAAFTKVWKDLGKPTLNASFSGVSIEFRPYKHYVKGTPKFSRNYFGKDKLKLAEGIRESVTG